MFIRRRREILRVIVCPRESHYGQREFFHNEYLLPHLSPTFLSVITEIFIYLVGGPSLHRRRPNKVERLTGRRQKNREQWKLSRPQSCSNLVFGRLLIILSARHKIQSSTMKIRVVPQRFQLRIQKHLFSLKGFFYAFSAIIFFYFIHRRRHGR